MSYSNEYLYRNMYQQEPPRSNRRLVVFAAIGCLVVCCACFGLILGIQYATGQPGTAISSLFARPTPTRDPNAPAALRTPTAGTNGMELTILAFQRPLNVEGTTKLSPNQQYVLTTIRLKNTRTTGAAVKVTPADFVMIGDGGLTYNPNPKAVTIKNILTEANVEPGKITEAELIFQIAVDDNNLKLIWTSGTLKRTIDLEPSK